MKFTVKQYAESLHEVIEQSSPKEHDKIINNFIGILKSNGDLAAYEKIVLEYEKLITLKANTSNIEITTASGANPSPTLLKELNRYAKEQAIITKTTDDSIIGGVIIKVDDTLIDASLKTQLNSMEANLKENL